MRASTNSCAEPTNRGDKVGRPDLTKLAGALQDLPFESGVVASATDFTRPAKRYAESTKVNPASKIIDLYHVRPSVETDEEGRIRSVALQLFILAPKFNKSKFEPVITVRGNEVLKGLYQVGDKVQVEVREIYRADGSAIITIFELTAQITRVSTTMLIEDSWIPAEPAYIKIAGALVEISELKYSIPREVEEIRIEIKPKGQTKLLIQSEDGTIDTLFTDEDLKRVKFLDNGNVEIAR